nr:immunoglobulin light chain junction region [Macaca mulatta]MOX74221.1 immunoglobulin light chain junction region [Macaca mulatta]MOX74318.1 immunoglobulin light chain junction region [Macaca mulatta]MOX75404.1 immunoglobulin light chain junction region [Macaca mulatta]
DYYCGSYAGSNTFIF